jgi:hypothetical protein
LDIVPGQRAFTRSSRGAKLGADLGRLQKNKKKIKMELEKIEWYFPYENVVFYNVTKFDLIPSNILTLKWK